MSWLVTAKQYIPAVIGEEFGGGYFAGYISHTADGNPTHALIVAPRATGATGNGYTLTTDLQWKTANTTTAGTTSTFDGVANTAAMVTAGIANHPAAQFCNNLSISSYTDWYLPSRYELDIAYFNLKPTSFANSTSNGINLYAVPPRSSNFTSNNPPVTSISLFAGGSEAFSVARHVTSTEVSSQQYFCSELLLGNSDPQFKTVPRSVRAFRRIAL